MNSRGRFLIAAGVVLLAGLLSIVYAPSLPERMATHWNAAGQPDGTMTKPVALAFIPAITAVTIGLLALIPRIDPLRENIAAFRPVYDWFVVVFAVFMTAIHAGIIAFNLGYVFDFTLLVLVLVAGLLFYVGILLSHAKRNWFVGIRTPWTLSSNRVWERTHELGARLFKISAFITLLGLFVGEYAIYFMVVPALLSAGITVIYSYYLYGRIEQRSDSDPVEST
jgi:uncharacterized membrane protein